MAAQRCSLCGIGYPNDYRFAAKKCAIHDEPFWLDNKSEPDENWQERAAYLLKQSMLDAEIAEVIPTVDGRVIHQAGQLWIHGWDIYPAVGRRLRFTDLVRVGKQVFEILEYVDATRLYLVRTFEMEVTDEGIAELLDGA